MGVDHRTIQRHFRRADPILAAVIKQVGPVTLRPERDRFKMLVRSILSQQISVGAARAIRLRLETRLASRKAFGRKQSRASPSSNFGRSAYRDRKPAICSTWPKNAATARFGSHG